MSQAGSEGKPGRPGKPGNSLGSLQIGRGVAAIAVLWSHVALLMNLDRYMGAGKVPLDAWFFPGYHGVDYFFVLSGFIIAHAHWKDIGEPSAVARYAWRRVIRIYPPYWVITIVLVCLYAARPELGADHQRDPMVIFTSLFLLPSGQSPVLPVAWTLRFEMLFYLSFVVFIVCGARIGALVYALWLAYIALWAPPSTQLLSLGSQHIVQFMLGMLICAIARRISLSRGQATALAVGGIVYLATLYLLEVLFAADFYPNAAYPLVALRDRYALLAWGVGSAVTILGLSIRDQTSVPSAKHSLHYRMWLLFGDASYSIYLFHVVAVSAAALLMFKLMPALAAISPLVIVVLIVAGLAGGVAFHLLVEKPLLAWIPKQPPTWFGVGGAPPKVASAPVMPGEGRRP